MSLTEKLRDHIAALPFRTGGTVVLRRFSRALGDNLMLTMLARELKRARPARKVVVESNRPELFRGNPNVDLVVVNKVFWRAWKPGYRIEEGTREHILDQLAKSLPVPLERWERRLELFLDEEEKREGLRGLPDDYVVVCPVGKGTAAANRKDWGFERFQALVDLLPGSKIVQVGLGEDPLLRGAIDCRGRDVRATAAVLQAATTSVLLEGGFMHLSHAVGRPAVVLYGGCLTPELTGYPEHLSVTARATCGPCFRSHGGVSACPHTDCMARISPEFVAGLVLEKRYRAGGVVDVP